LSVESQPTYERCHGSTLKEIVSRGAQLRVHADEQVRVAALREIFEGSVRTLRSGYCGPWRGSAPNPHTTDAAVAKWGYCADFVVLKRPRWRNPAPDWRRSGDPRCLLLMPTAAARDTARAPPTPFGRRVALAGRQAHDQSRAGCLAQAPGKAFVPLLIGFFHEPPD
jgi:hypothetical protein